MSQKVKASPLSAAQESQLMADLWSPQIAENPLAFVLYAFPWQKKGTPLEKHKGPRRWQREELQAIATHIAENKNRIRQGKAPLVYKSATVSGRGVGKSSLVAWLILWNMSCNYGATTIVSANNESQLQDKTWAELGKWHTLLINGHWFEKMAMQLRPNPWFEQELKMQLKIDTGYYYANAQLWSEERPDAFAGVHNETGVMVIFDEASGIPAPIWNVSDGFFTEPSLHRYFFAFSNGRRPSGMFFECFHRFRDYWKRRNLDSRLVEGTDKDYLEGIIRQNGEDSDVARVEVRGMFPKQGDRQFISREIADQARTREVEQDPWAALILGVDVARFGDDCSVIAFRQGRDARSIPWKKFQGIDNMQLAMEVAAAIDKHKPDAVCIDVGNGTGVIDRLRDLGYKVHEVGFGSKSPEPEYADNRTYIWAEMRNWLGGGAIPDSGELYDDLVGPEYVFQGDRTKLEAKEFMKKRGLASPDMADALACTFAVKVSRRDGLTSRRARQATQLDTDYDVIRG